ncbi:ABC transporter ATP-binding protein [Falsiroseomonas oryziterrae]|uniref:ABC transporter ATP-binding protein n=1 Tax=Falsiroseomonas oryziterrae TaxID=2911368 RepID=UPI0023514BE4|nr:ABC transporter ATP-binding protein [Roseomonas sp. NPKOSM-4]
MILLDGVSKFYAVRGFGRRWILRDTTAVIRPGDRLGILGRNGSGKSTLIRLLGGVEYPSSGAIERRMTVSWPLAHGIGVHSQLTGSDNARFVARIYDLDPEELVEAVDHFAELGSYMDMPVATYSAGMMSRLLLGLSMAMDFDCYLIDEATSVGDHRFIERTQLALETRLRDRAVVMVSHSAVHIRTFCRTAAILHDGYLTFFEDLDEAIATYEAL